MKNFKRLLAAVRAISPQAHVSLIQVPDNEDMWVVRIAVHDVVLVETGAGLVEPLIRDATHKIEAMSQRMMTAARGSIPPSS